MLIRMLCNGDIPRASLLLGNTQAITGVLALFLNQFGGKLSDALGRRAFMLIGPVGNMIVGSIVFMNHTNLPLVLVCRVIKQMITTFSNTVIATAALTDFLSGQELALGLGQLGGMYGAAVFASPLIETQLLRITGTPRYAYLQIAVLGAIQALYMITMVPETLEPEKRRPIDIKGALNVFGFLNIFRKGKNGLQKIVCTMTMQMVTEGKNLVDVSQNLMTQRLGFSVVQNGNFLSSAAFCYMASGWYCTPWMLNKFSPRMFTTVGNLFIALGYGIQGPATNLYVYWAAFFLLTPGVNGAASTALRAVAADQAAAQGFGRGEFQGWCNNMRALAGAAAPLIYGHYYAFAERSGIWPGTVHWLAVLLGAVLPQMLLATVPDEQLTVRKKG